MALQVVFQNRQNALILNTFFDAKSDEIVNVFADGPELDLKPLVAALKLIDAGRTNKYETLIK